MILATDKTLPFQLSTSRHIRQQIRHLHTIPHYLNFKLKQKTTIPWTAAYEVAKPTTHFSVHGLDHSFNAHYPISIHNTNTAPLQKDEAEPNVTFHRSWTKQASPYRCVTHILRMMPSSTSSFEDDVLSRPAEKQRRHPHSQHLHQAQAKGNHKSREWHAEFNFQCHQFFIKEQSPLFLNILQSGLNLLEPLRFLGADSFGKR